VTETRPSDTRVRHSSHGVGRVVTDLGETCIVRFDARVEQVLSAELEDLPSVEGALNEGRLDDPLATLIKAQALAIRSVNDQWGVFSRSRVQLLPHQLWVCRQVTRQWPFRWLVADDVGLGKTIEAGLILTPLLASGRVKRLLILAPARLVPQWRVRLKTMFDIRLQEYSAELDRGRLSLWETATQVVASFHTLRGATARERLLKAEPWDLVFVDEAHHFQAQEHDSTLTYQLLEKLQEAERITSLVLFTGTPHRGKDFGFLALMRLVRPDLFDPKKEQKLQLPVMHQAMIRNNKAHVTDLRGNKLFKPVTTTTVEFHYSNEEAAFYDTMSEFILDGRAYAMSLSGREQSARMLLLIALQKLAASSIAAILSALERRRDAMSMVVEKARVKMPIEDDSTTLDEAAEAEEALPQNLAVLLMEDEIVRLDDLIGLARAVGSETKIDQLTSLIDDSMSEGEPVLLFTEYKMTQALVFSVLEARYGVGSVGFINGDDRLNIVSVDGTSHRVLRLGREIAAENFNAGQTRFLISTEAGGEGIDLQERCATLIHVDLPWNPMRLHQRVGRLNRYGQRRSVSVFLLRNPETVEARIWSLLEVKLDRIQTALSSVMEEAEDIVQLVIGMAGSNFFDDLFADPQAKTSESLTDWFDARTATFGGREAVETVRDLVGNVARYDFQSVGGDLPKLDLPDLESFFRHAMHANGRRVTKGREGLSVATPEQWRRYPDLRDRYDDLLFDRGVRPSISVSRIIGVGHALLDQALAEAEALNCCLARVKGLDSPLIVASVEDELTGTGATVHRVILGVEQRAEEVRILRDWELLQRLNEVDLVGDGVPQSREKEIVKYLWSELLAVLPKQNLSFRRPRAIQSVLLLPTQSQ
jgi:ERCC4-related helicase